MPSNTHPPPIKWTVYRAAREFRISPDTLRRRLGAAGQSPGADGCYSSYQLRLAFSDEVAAARLEKNRAETKLINAKLGVIEREYLKRGPMTVALSNTYGAMRRVIERSPLDDRSRIALLRILGAGPETLLESMPEERDRLTYLGKKPPQRKSKSNGDHARSTS